MALNNFLKYLTDEQNEYLSKNKTHVDYKKGETIIKQGTPANHVVYLEKGLARLNITDQSITSCIDLCISDSFIGLMCSFNDKNFLFSTVAIEDCRISIIDKEAINSLLKENNDFSIAIINYISETTANMVFWMSRLRYKHIDGSVAILLLKFSKYYSNLSFELPVTRIELAEIIGYSKESVINTLSKFKKEEIISINNRNNIDILSIDRLETIAAKA